MTKVKMIIYELKEDNGIMNCWKILQITRTTDKKVIKGAYAELLRLYHPEENPEMFQRIRDAYKSAMEYAKENALEDKEYYVDDNADNDMYLDDVVYNNMNVCQVETDDKSFNEKNTQLAEAFEAVFGEQAHVEHDAQEELLVDTSLLWKRQIAIAKKLMKGKNKESIYEWTVFLSSAEFQKVKYDINFIRRFYKLCYWSNGSRELFDEILRFYKLAEYENELISSVEGRIEPGVEIINTKHKWIQKLKNFLLKYDRDGRWVQYRLVLHNQWNKMKNEWEAEEWFLFFIISFVILISIGYFFMLLFGLTDLSYSDWIDVLFDR